MPISLSKSERLILMYQFEILQIIDPSRAAEYANKLEIVQSGYRSIYHELGEVEGELPEEIYTETAAILDMFRVLKASYCALADKTGIDPKDVEFAGFDGNDEASHYGIATFMIGSLGRWSELKNSELNSHWNYLPRYRRMLARYGSMARNDQHSHTLAKDQIMEIVGD